MDHQDIFNIVYLGAASQGFEPSSRYIEENDTYPCYYRHPNDSKLKCNAGHFIRDELYDESFESSRFCSAYLEHIHRDLGLDEYQIRIIEKLQALHDSVPALADPAKAHKRFLKEYARLNNLIVPAVEDNKNV